MHPAGQIQSQPAYHPARFGNQREWNHGRLLLAVYSYIATSPLVEQISFKQGSVPRMTTTRKYDRLNRLQNITSVPSADPSVGFDYTYNFANQRTLRREADQAYWRYEYDSLGQVKSGKKFWADGTPVAGQQFEYAHDDIGNRTSTKTGGDENGMNLRASAYFPNLLNQYTSRTVPGAVDVMGLALGTNTVTVDGQAPYRKGEYFRKELSVNNNLYSRFQEGTSATNTIAHWGVKGNVLRCEFLHGGSPTSAALLKCDIKKTLLVATLTGVGGWKDNIQFRRSQFIEASLSEAGTDSLQPWLASQ